MNNLCTLVKYEWKKLLQKRMVRVAVMLVVMLMAISNLTFLTENHTLSYTNPDGSSQVVYSRTGYERMQDDKDGAWHFDGRAVDDEMLDEIMDSYADYGTAQKYSRIASMIGKMVENSEGISTLRADKMYGLWKQNIRKNLTDYYLSEGELAYWEKRMGNIRTPFTYRYGLGWENMLDNQCSGIALLVAVLSAVCLSGMFADESRLKTDQLVLCTENGKKPAYFAKIIVGTCFGAGSSLLLYGISFGFNFYFYGTAGFYAILQQTAVWGPYPLSVGQAVLILFGLTVLAGILESIFAMMLSLFLDNNVAALAAMMGILLLSFLVSPPERFRLISQVWNFLPTCLLGVGSYFDGRLVPVFGNYLTNHQFAAWIYSFLAIMFTYISKRKYTSYR